MSQSLVLGQRSLRESIRTPEALLPTLFIPLFFLVVNVGQAAKIFPSGSTTFLEGQNYAAFQLPSSLLLAASFGTAALYLVRGHRGRLLRQAAGRARLTDRHRVRPPVRRGGQEHRHHDSHDSYRAAVRHHHRQRPTRLSATARADGRVGGGVLRLHAADRAEDAQRRRDQLGWARVLPVALPHAELRPARPAHPGPWRSQQPSTRSPTSWRRCARSSSRTSRGQPSAKVSPSWQSSAR